MFIDFSSKPPTAAFRQESGNHLSNYRRIYAASEARVSDAGTEQESLEGYFAMYERLDARKVVVKARDVETTFGVRVPNEHVAELCSDSGGRLIGFAGVDPHKGMRAVRELEHAVRELGLRGLNLQCFEHQLLANDRRMYPLYAKCVELGVPVNIHAGTNFSRVASMEPGRPIYLDDVLRDFPELRVCASPPGWPWVEELMGIAWRHPNLWIGLVAVRPRYLARSNSGYGALLTYGASLMSDRIIFGTSWPMLPVEEALADIDALPLNKDVKAKWLHENAAHFLELS